MKKLKIEVITKYFYPIAAGIETNILETYKVLAKKGNDVTVHTSKDTYLEKNSLPDSETIQGIKVKRYSYGSDLKGYMPQINWDGVDVIALHNFNVSHARILLKVLWLKLRKRKKFALVITPHGGYNPDWKIFNWATRIKKFIYQYTLGTILSKATADGFRAVSDWEKDQMINRGIPSKKIEVITNGLEDEAFMNVEKLASKEMVKKIKEYGNYIIQVARIYPIKNFETVIKSLPLVTENLNFVIVGTVADEKYFEKLKDLAKKLGVEKRVFFAGVVRGADKYYLMKKAKMMVHMARWESFCNVVHEGLSQGLVCIVADNTALPLLIKDGVNGFVSKTKDHKSLAQKINYVFENFDSKEISTIRETNKKIGVNDSWKSVAEKMINFYDLLLKKVTGKPKPKIRIIVIGFFLFAFLIAVYGATLRGNWNSPSVAQIGGALSKEGQAFETSQERSRYAMILSLLNEGVFSIDTYASIGTPDVGFINGHYYSLFPPGASVLAIPLYLLGLKVGATQIFTFLISTIFAILTLLLIVVFARKHNITWAKSIFAALAFGFATNAWGYSITFYAHLISAFLILWGLYIATTKDEHSVGESILFWFLYAIAVYLDFPNVFIFLPIAIIFSLSGFKTSESLNKFVFSIKSRYLLSPLIFMVLMGGYGYYNYVHFGGPMVLSNTIPRVKDQITEVFKPEAEVGKESVNALETRNMLNGFLTFTVNIDRGIAIYSPVVLLSLFAAFGATKKLSWKSKIGLVAVPSTCLTLYTMFGDPYGGWAFGSRYMIATLPQLCILSAIALDHLDKNFIVKLVYTIVFLYSLGVSLLAPLTTNVIPPRVEAVGLGLTYDYRVNIKMMSENNLNSFVFNNYAKSFMNGWQYYWTIYSLVATLGVVLIWLKPKTYEINNI